MDFVVRTSGVGALVVSALSVSVALFPEVEGVKLAEILKPRMGKVTMAAFGVVVALVGVSVVVLVAGNEIVLLDVVDMLPDSVLCGVVATVSPLSIVVIGVGVILGVVVTSVTGDILGNVFSNVLTVVLTEDVALGVVLRIVVGKAVVTSGALVVDINGLLIAKLV